MARTYCEDCQEPMEVPEPTLEDMQWRGDPVLCAHCKR